MNETPKTGMRKLTPEQARDLLPNGSLHLPEDLWADVLHQAWEDAQQRRDVGKHHRVADGGPWHHGARDPCSSSVERSV